MAKRLEQMALAGVPSIVIDLKGDLSSLACVPEGASTADVARDLIRLHGTGERIRIADADRAVEFFLRLVRRACG